MKAILSLLLLLAASAYAEEGADRVAIIRVIAALNQSPQPDGLFTAGADAAALEKLSSAALRWVEFIPGPQPGATGSMTVVISHEPWGEVRLFPEPRMELTNPRISAGKIQFIAADVAVADGTFRYIGADGVAHDTALVFVMKNDGGTWRIALIRLGGATPVTN